MSQKLVFVGPPGVGKTTLRKVFFEGECSRKLLAYAIEPTYGKETVILNLSQKVGIFDLAGQENERWLDSTEKMVFEDTKVIILVNDVTKPIEEIVSFTKKVVEVRDEVNPDALIYLLIHKIDLLDDEDVIHKKIKVINQLASIRKIKINFTSIKEDHFTKSLYLFLEILKETLGEELKFTDSDFNLLKNIIKLLILFKDKNIYSRSEIIKEAGFTNGMLDKIVNILLAENHLQTSVIDDETMLILTQKGREYYNDIMQKFSDLDLQIMEENYHGLAPEAEVPAPPIVGLFVADRDGKLLMLAEVIEGEILKYMGGVHYNSNTFDLDLIPMFISALEKFSEEINITSLDGFKLKGGRLSMFIYHLEIYTITVFTNPNINLKLIIKDVQNYLNKVIEQNSDTFYKATKRGDVSILSSIRGEIIEWIHDINKKYNHLLLDLSIIDFEKTKLLYERLDEINNALQRSFEEKINKVKNLKIALMKASLDEDLIAIKELSKNIQELTSKFLT
ncbi:MAG: hypothetical protein ACTSR8_15805 [Promethearchaeota archaeon]